MDDHDFYFDSDGRKVMTSTYLKKRGYCCETGCRHCPYGFENKPFIPDPPPDVILASLSKNTPELEDY
jgi:hypothetical protein